MLEKKKVLSVIENASQKTMIKDLFPAVLYAPVQYVDTADAARRLLQQERFDLLVLMASAREGYGISLAAQAGASLQTGVLLFIKPEHYDQACYQLKDTMAFVLSLPLHKTLSTQAISCLEKSLEQVQKMQQQLAKEKQKLREEKVFTRCKLLLMEQYGWSEEKAHRYLEKTAMDHSMTKGQVARRLLEMMQERKK